MNTRKSFPFITHIHSSDLFHTARGVNRRLESIHPMEMNRNRNCIVRFLELSRWIDSCRHDSNESEWESKNHDSFFSKPRTFTLIDFFFSLLTGIELETLRSPNYTLYSCANLAHRLHWQKMNSYDTYVPQIEFKCPHCFFESRQKRKKKSIAFPIPNAFSIHCMSFSWAYSVSRMLRCGMAPICWNKLIAIIISCSKCIRELNDR